MFVCWMCHRVFNTCYKLDCHLNRIHKYNKSDTKSDKKPIECDWPPNIQNLARHIDGVKTFFCKLCSYSVNRCDSMTKHIARVHSKGRVIPEHQCEVCGKVFIEKTYLRNHMVSHNKERQYKCHVCGQDFHRQASLKRHTQGHSDSKQFSCTLCDYQTNRKNLIYRHVDMHKSGRAYSCVICKTQFFTQFAFRSHMFTHKPTPNSCFICKVNFSSRERMLCHMENVHSTLTVTVIDMKKGKTI